MRDALARHVVVRQDAGAVRLALQTFLIELCKELSGRDLRAKERRRLAEKRDPCVHVIRAVVAVHHGNRRAAGRGDHVDLGIDLRERLFKNHHREDRRAGIALRRAERNARGQEPAEIRAAARCEQSRRLPGGQDLRKDVAEAPVKAVLFSQRAELVQHHRVIAERLAVDGEHAGGLPYADGVFAREQEMHIARQRCDVRDLADMVFSVQNRLIQVRDRPALRDVEAERLRELCGGLSGHGVLPCPERRQQVPVLVKGEIAVHHARDAHRRDLARQLAEIPDRGAKPCLHGVHVICPDAVFQTAFPCRIAAFYDLMRLVQQNRLDARRAELNAEKILFHTQHLTNPCFYATKPDSGSQGTSRSLPRR